jgi:hypothetical protein
MWIGGDNSFKSDVNKSLYKINATGLGNIVLNSLKGTRFSALTIRPETAGELLSLGGNGYDDERTGYGVGTIIFGGANILVDVFSNAHNSSFTNLGHELWHAFEHSRLGATYIAMTKTYDDQMLLEQGAVGFENYLCAVYNISHIRNGYGAKTFWEKPTANQFNPAGESIKYILQPSISWGLDRPNPTVPIYEPKYSRTNNSVDLSKISLYW